MRPVTSMERKSRQLMNVERHGVDRRYAELCFGVEVNAERQHDQPCKKISRRRVNRLVFPRRSIKLLLQTKTLFILSQPQRRENICNAGRNEKFVVSCPER